ncbi:MAG: hypothetical protein EP326_00770 [Deltaproteobacteria bacterium]|nr:MAG: hypothetical protein EP326_00770 [Deltaproteobacteria bacterium]
MMKLFYLFFTLLLTTQLFAQEVDESIEVQEEEQKENFFKSKAKELVDKIGDERIEQFKEGAQQVGRLFGKNHLALKGGANYSVNRIKTKTKTDDYYGGWGFNTHFGYHWTYLELSGSSYIHFGKTEELEFVYNDTVVSGAGTVRFVSIAPMARIHTTWEPKKNYRFYFGGGPIWSIETVKIQSTTTSLNAFQEQTKITYESNGGIAVFGIEEQTPFKEMHPAFMEISFIYQRSYRVSTVDTSKAAETNILSTQRSFNDLQTFNIVFSIGITIF